uniref:Uncharacterized protein n=1 Tax=Rhizophora mucronata TaxID=61149 RepID=A0A2P2QSB2_RHIMU
MFSNDLILNKRNSPDIPCLGGPHEGRTTRRRPQNTRLIKQLKSDVV